MTRQGVRSKKRAGNPEKFGIASPEQLCPAGRPAVDSNDLLCSTRLARTLRAKVLDWACHAESALRVVLHIPGDQRFYRVFFRTMQLETIFEVALWHCQSSVDHGFVNWRNPKHSS